MWRFFDEQSDKVEPERFAVEKDVVNDSTPPAPSNLRGGADDHYLNRVLLFVEIRDIRG